MNKPVQYVRIETHTKIMKLVSLPVTVIYRDNMLAFLFVSKHPFKRIMQVHLFFRKTATARQSFL